MKSKLAKALNVESITLKHLGKNMRFYNVEIHVYTHTHTHTHTYISIHLKQYIKSTNHGEGNYKSIIFNLIENC